MAIIAFDPIVAVCDRGVYAWPRDDGKEPGPAFLGPLSEALATSFAWDAHVQPAVVPGVAHRLWTAGGDGAIGRGARLVAVVFDVDTPHHTPITDAWWADLEPRIQRLRQERGCRPYAYTTAHGARIVYALAEPHELATRAAAARWTASYLAWTDVLRDEYGIVADRKCADPFHLFRLPRVRRGDQDVTPRHEIGEPDRIGRWTEEFLPADDPRCLPPPAPDLPPAAAAPVAEDDLVVAAGALAAAWPPRGRHYATLALASALARLGWSEEAIADFAIAVCGLAGDDDVGHHQKCARDACDHAARGGDLMGWESVAEHGSLGDDGRHNDDQAAAITAAVLVARRALGDPPPGEIWAAAAALARAAGPTVEELAVAALGPDATQADVDVFRAVLDWAAEQWTAAMSAIGAAQAAAPRPFFGTSRELRAQDHPPPEWLIRDLVTRLGVGALAAEPKSGKSWISTEFGVGVASGTPVLGRYAVDRPGWVAYFYAEDDAGSVVVRQRALEVPRRLAADGWLDRFLVQPRGRSVDLTKDVDCVVLIASAAFARARAAGEPWTAGPSGLDLLILDPLSDIHSGEEDKRDSMAPIMKRLRVIGQVLGCAVLFVHHATKVNADTSRRRPGQRMRGSGAIHGAVDFGVYLDFDAERSSKDRFVNGVHSEVKGARSAGEFELTLQVVDDAAGHAREASWSIGERRTVADKKADETEDKLATVVQKLFDHGAPMTRDDLKRRVGGGTDVLQRTIEEGVKEGLIARAMNGGRSLGYELTREGRKFARSGRPREELTTEPAPSAIGGMLAGYLAGKGKSGPAESIRSE